MTSTSGSQQRLAVRTHKRQEEKEKRATAHREYESPRRPGEKFSLPWVGINATREERRQYMHAFLLWISGVSVPNPEGCLVYFRKKIETITVKGLMRDGASHVKDTRFEFHVDRVFWNLWTGKMPNQPPFPWHDAPQEEEGEGLSETWAWMYFDLMVEGKVPTKQSIEGAAENAARNEALAAEDRAEIEMNACRPQ
ncbi:hypothetical protein FZEAL_8936 [Fusarium zealandicum]|uniref:Uncharacterized protein n=1 Tax=Fusarium zealandicum TaxID=1053134 RepID=A0A8H4XGD6_9HYPO|nr:hypothetical protein FZEAL_8936 [Fusarium zealandicum]